MFFQVSLEPGPFGFPQRHHLRGCGLGQPPDHLPLHLGRPVFPLRRPENLSETGDMGQIYRSLDAEFAPKGLEKLAVPLCTLQIQLRERVISRCRIPINGQRVGNVAPTQKGPEPGLDVALEAIEPGGGFACLR